MTKRRKHLEEALEKLLSRQEEIAAKIRETQEQIVEETNTEIHEIVHAANLTPEQLAEVLQLYKKGTIPGNIEEIMTGEEEKSHVF